MTRAPGALRSAVPFWATASSEAVGTSETAAAAINGTSRGIIAIRKKIAGIAIFPIAYCETKASCWMSGTDRRDDFGFGKNLRQYDGLVRARRIIEIQRHTGAPIGAQQPGNRGIAVGP